ncbi:hypothetical protein RJ639_029511, partial [Escallonia herrerae]
FGEFDIQYKPHTTIKAQTLADFIIECTLPEDPPQLLISKAPDPWNLYVDGSSAVASSGAGIILISPEGFVVEYALRFGFQALNNEAEYEALLTGIRLVHALKVDSLSVHNDSQLVVNHVLGDYEARDEQMAQYLQLVKTSASKRTPSSSREGHGFTGPVPIGIWSTKVRDYEAMLPVEIGVPTLRALHFNECLGPEPQLPSLLLPLLSSLPIPVASLVPQCGQDSQLLTCLDLRRDG